MRTLRIVTVAALLLAALAAPLAVNPRLFGANCAHTEAVSINCDLAQTQCSDCGTPNPCLTTCQETQAQPGNFTWQPTPNNTQVQQIAQILCNKVYGCKVYPLTGGCILDTTDTSHQNQYKQPWMTVNCP